MSAITRKALVVSRKWHEPKISVVVNVEGISMAMTMEDFVRAFCTEMGHPELADKALAAGQEVVNEMKQASVAVM
jgi:hypothetical protein